MYTSRTGFVLGFHGTEERIVSDVINNKTDLRAKNNTYDWLGNGIYFWDDSPIRALEWAVELSKRKGSNIKTPAVVGAILDLGYCLDLLDYKNSMLIKEGYYLLQSIYEISEQKIPENRGFDLLMRELDCAVIETLHKSILDNNENQFDSVRGVFWEGKPLYPNAGFREKDHIQICVLNIDCIKGYFLPLERVQS